MRSFVILVCLLFSNHLLFANSEQLGQIVRLKQYEYNLNRDFQKSLLDSSLYYFDSRVEKFVDEETGFFAIWSEAFRFYESDIKTKERWANKVKKYFNATSYTIYINSLIDKHETLITVQRNDFLNKHIYSLTETSSNLKIKGFNHFDVSDEQIDKLVLKIKQMVITEVVSELLDTLLWPLFVFLIFVLLGIAVHPYISIFFTIVMLLFSVFSSVKLSSDITCNLQVELRKLHSVENLNVIDDLNKSTCDYYQTIHRNLNSK